MRVCQMQQLMNKFQMLLSSCIDSILVLENDNRSNFNDKANLFYLQTVFLTDVYIYIGIYSTEKITSYKVIPW